MPPLTKSPALPKIEVVQDRKSFKVDWDYQHAPESDALFENREFLEGYILGAIDALGISRENISCLSAEAGTVKSLPQELADRLAELIKHKLHSVVTEAHRCLANHAKLPHVRLAQGD
ncbi:hypothetical protein N5D79_06505 [Pseudomonas sp. GD03817]|uniref:Uncharacterized protein n=1 Tax=Pseudomonas putida TaxID=303 RepID=A0A1L5PT51_PSEPU|nr:MULTISPECIES: hypothetical protein [Pseudomonas]APO83350.1 hypothetical protein BL240_18635 [Pseudomonas putida]KIY42361.1 hypothetical protein TZ03_03625 [Pseudomonas sp. 10-1B]MBA6136393.1 hypothetical protein [Pseudomonas monteilii]MCE0989677.1 hypothetical protein [Pseudomonas alloputida]MDH1400700.1 hypothetical protein [Pseudomonas sp. GD03730]